MVVDSSQIVYLSWSSVEVENSFEKGQPRWLHDFNSHFGLALWVNIVNFVSQICLLSVAGLVSLFPFFLFPAVFFPFFTIFFLCAMVVSKLSWHSFLFITVTCLFVSLLRMTGWSFSFPRILFGVYAGFWFRIVICWKGVRFILDNARVLHPSCQWWWVSSMQAGQGCSRQGLFSSSDYQHLPAFHLGITKTTQEGVVSSFFSIPVRVQDQTPNCCWSMSIHANYWWS